MRVQAMSSRLRVTMSPTEAKAIAKLIAAGDDTLGAFSPDCAADIMAALQLGASEVKSKQEDARRRRAEMTAKPKGPPFRNVMSNGFTIAATLGDWIDAAPADGGACWIALTPEREAMQAEVRRNVWQVCVLNPDPYGSLHLGVDCTLSADEAEIQDTADRMTAALANAGAHPV